MSGRYLLSLLRTYPSMKESYFKKVSNKQWGGGSEKLTAALKKKQGQNFPPTKIQQWLHPRQPLPNSPTTPNLILETNMGHQFNSLHVFLSFYVLFTQPDSQFFSGPGQFFIHLMALVLPKHGALPVVGTQYNVWLAGVHWFPGAAPI